MHLPLGSSLLIALMVPLRALAQFTAEPVHRLIESPELDGWALLGGGLALLALHRIVRGNASRTDTTSREPSSPARGPV